MTFGTLFARTVWRLRSKGARGYVDWLDRDRVAGWLALPAGRKGPARLSLHIDGRHAMNIAANLERADVQEAGIGPLHCGFDARMPRQLRDGAPHLVELRVGEDGPVIPGGRIRLEALTSAKPAAPGLEPASDAPGDPAPPVPVQAEGVIFLDRANNSLTGWAIGGGRGSVFLSLDGGEPVTVPLDREVPGFGSGHAPGFRLALPPAMLDGEWHEAVAAHQPGGPPLDGCPLRFRLRPGRPDIDLVNVSGRDLVLRLRDAQGVPVDLAADLPVTALADGQEIVLRGGDNGRLDLTLPPDARHLVLTHDGDTLARYVIGQNGPEPLSVAEPGDMLALDDATPGDAGGDIGPDRARAAFDAFCDAPDARFDPLWYVHRHGLTGLPAGDPDAALRHYRQTGAAAGLSPGPWFDEAAARALHPDLAVAIAEGRLPCAFAVELVLGPGMLGSLTGIDPAARAALDLEFRAAAPDPARALRTTVHLGQNKGLKKGLNGGPDTDLSEPAAAIPPRLPQPTSLQDPAKGIYAAWLARLDIPAATRSDIAADEARIRAEIAVSSLYQAPLVSIIMPSWNRAFTIGEAIQSVLDQSYANWELLICDDASEDRTAEVVRGFDDPRIRYMKFAKSNGAGARNKGLRFARGDFIAYLDSDNIWHPLFLDMMIRRLAETPGSAIAYSAYLDTEITGATVNLHTVSRPAFRPIQLSSRNFMDLNTIVHHRRIYDWMGGFDNDLPRLQDWDLVLRYTSVFRPLFVNRIGVFYRRNAAWGQVTHLFQGAAVQNTVNEKTRRRLEEAHEVLTIPWPARSRVTVLLGAETSDSERALGESLARLAAGCADVDLVDMGNDAAVATDNDPPGLLRHQVPDALRRDPARLGHALADLIAERPILGVAAPRGWLRALGGLDTARTVWLRGTGEGVALQGLADPALRFYLGALPLALPDAGATDSKRPLVLVIPGDARNRHEQATTADALAAAAAAEGIDLLFPPMAGSAAWTLRSRGQTEHRLPMPGGHLPREIGQVAMTVSLQAVSALDPFRFSLLSTLQARGIPAAVLADAGRARGSGFADQWIEARAVYEIKVATPKWVFDKARKLLQDSGSLTRLSDRSRIVNSIAQHPDLVRERVADAIFALRNGLPFREVPHDRT